MTYICNVDRIAEHPFSVQQDVPLVLTAEVSSNAAAPSVLLQVRCTRPDLIQVVPVDAVPVALRVGRQEIRRTFRFRLRTSSVKVGTEYRAWIVDSTTSLVLSEERPFNGTVTR